MSVRAEAASNTGPSAADSAAANTDGGSGRATRVRWGNALAPPAANTQPARIAPMRVRCERLKYCGPFEGSREPTLGGIGPEKYSFGRGTGATAPPAVSARTVPRVWDARSGRQPQPGERSSIPDLAS